MDKVIFNNYTVNEKGEVYSIKRRRKLKTSLNYKGYEQIYLSINGKHLTTFIHRLIGIAFIPNPLNLPQINHKDGNKLNNNIDNLEWVDDITNQIHAFKNNLKIRKKIKMHDSKLGLEKEFDSISECSRFLNTTQYNVSRVCSGKRKSLYGRYTFEYVS